MAHTSARRGCCSASPRRTGRPSSFWKFARWIEREGDEGVNSHRSPRTDKAGEGLVIVRVLDAPGPEDDVERHLMVGMAMTHGVVGGECRVALRHPARHPAGELSGAVRSRRSRGPVAWGASRCRPRRSPARCSADRRSSGPLAAPTPDSPRTPRSRCGTPSRPRPARSRLPLAQRAWLGTTAAPRPSSRPPT